MPPAIRNLFFAFIGFGLVFLSACADRKITPFDLNFENTFFKVQPNNLPGTRVYTNQVITSNTDSFLQIEGIPRDEFKSARPLSVIISIEDSNGTTPVGPYYNFNSFDSVQLIMTAPDVKDVVTIARILTVPKGVTKFSLDTVGVDVVNMLRQAEFKFELRGRSIDTVYTELPVRMRVAFDCQAEKSR